MPEQPPVSPTTPPPPDAAANPSPDPAVTTPPAAPKGPTINIGEEYGTAKKNLPPTKVVLIALGIVLVVVIIASVVKRPKPQGAGSLDNVVAVEVPGQTTTMVALTFTLHNTSDKAMYIQGLHGVVKTASGDTKADARSAVDFDRYFQAFPALKNGAQPALAPETEIPPGGSVTRTILVAFPMTLDAFNQRKSVSVEIWPYNYTVPVVLTK
jgi:hypothetical protein